MADAADVHCRKVHAGFPFGHPEPAAGTGTELIRRSYVSGGSMAAHVPCGIRVARHSLAQPSALPISTRPMVTLPS